MFVTRAMNGNQRSHFSVNSCFSFNRAIQYTLFPAKFQNGRLNAVLLHGVEINIYAVVTVKTAYSEMLSVPTNIWDKPSMMAGFHVEVEVSESHYSDVSGTGNCVVLKDATQSYTRADFMYRQVKRDPGIQLLWVCYSWQAGFLGNSQMWPLGTENHWMVIF